MRISVRLLCVSALAFSTLSPGAAGAQSHHHHPFRPTSAQFPIIPNLGKLNHKVECNPAAQAYFNQGLTLLYGFNYDGSYASFREALGKDTSCAMAEWGMALALGANINIDISPERMEEAATHVDRARQLPGASTRDREYIAALARRYSHDPNADTTQLAVDYSVAMEGLWRNYWLDGHQDPDAAVLYAESLMDLRPWRLWTRDGRPYDGTEHVVSVLESVLGDTKTADHVGAVHYHLHALEPSPRWPQAIGDAEKLRTLVPASGHLVHMPSHIYLLQGAYDKAAKSNEDAITQDVWYKEHVADDGYVGHYLSHNRHFLTIARGLQGNYEEASLQVSKLWTTVTEHIGKEPGLEHYLTTPTLLFARFARWQLLIDTPVPPRERRIQYTMWLWGKAVGYAGKGEVQNARAFQKDFRNAAAAAGCTLSWGNNPTGEVLKVADLDLSARIASAAGDQAAAAQILKLAADAERDLLYDEPPPWILVSKGRYPAATTAD